MRDNGWMDRISRVIRVHACLLGDGLGGGSKTGRDETRRVTELSVEVAAD